MHLPVTSRFRSLANLISQRAACGGTGTLVMTLKDGILTDNQNRQGYVVGSNSQFQFDGPPGPQAGALFTAGFSVCGNGSLALGPSAVFYECLSGTFYNLYYNATGTPMPDADTKGTKNDNCMAIAIDVIPCGGSSTGSASGLTATATATVASDGQPQGTSVVTQISDAQPQAPSAIAVSEFTDGQPQVQSSLMAQLTATAVVSQQTDGQPTASSAAAVSVQTDGQPTAGNATTVATPTSSALSVFTGAANAYHVGAEFAAMVAGVAAVVML